MKIVIALQARTDSSRLPAKVLLPIGGYPLSVLAAKRAARNGLYDILVLTSNQPSDDYFCAILKQYKIPFYRGELNDVLNRFTSAFPSYDDATIVVRLTGDNFFPDSEFISEVVEYFKEHDLQYLAANGESSGIPYGASVEVTKLEHLREADKNTISPFDREHVTPYIRRKYGESYFKSARIDNLGSLRCTIDSLDDYLRMTSLLEFVNNAIDIKMEQLCELLSNQYQYHSSESAKLVIGAAQLGLDYGINNTIGMPSQQVAHEILSEAVHAGVCYIDTARAYNLSENVIGSWLQKGWQGRVKVITKLDPLTHISNETSDEKLLYEVEKSVLTSLYNLKTESLDVLMLHRAEHLIQFDGVVYNHLLRLKNKGVIKALGVSVQTPEELILALDFEHISYIQMPFNILDNRWQEAIKDIYRVKAERKLNVHVRSVFLQGLLLNECSDTWINATAESPENIQGWLRAATQMHKCSSIQELCVKYVKSHSWIDALVIGCESIEQLSDNLKNINSSCLSDIAISKISSLRPSITSPALLNPAKWFKNEK